MRGDEIGFRCQKEKVKKVFRSRPTRGIVLLATGITSQGSLLLFEDLTLDIGQNSFNRFPSPLNATNLCTEIHEVGIQPLSSARRKSFGKFPALPLSLLAAFSLLAVLASSAQTVNRQTGAVCEAQPPDTDAIRSKAETGDVSAEYELGRAVLSPRPTESEVASAMPWFQRSAEQGYAPAEYMYGSIFREGRWKNPNQLVYWWTKAAEQGNVHAQLWLGVYYEQGRYGIERDYFKAFKWLSMAAKQGQPDAQVTLGQMYEDGEGVQQDYRLAAYWYRKAADHTIDLGGAGVGANSLVQLYQDGHATPQDYVFVYLGYAYLQDADGMRDVAQKMNANQIADVQRRLRAWINSDAPCPSTETSPSTSAR